MKIQMLTSQRIPEAYPPLPCYLAGQTYELATTEEIAMGKGFIRDGVAVAVSASGGLVKGFDSGVPAVLQGTDFLVTPAMAEGLGKMAQAGAVSVGDAVTGDGTGETPPPASNEVREAPGVTVVAQGAGPSDAEVIKAVDKALKRAKPRR